MGKLLLLVDLFMIFITSCVSLCYIACAKDQFIADVKIEAIPIQEARAWIWEYKTSLNSYCCCTILKLINPQLKAYQLIG
ncbi:hypothetical protein TH53_08210 [Pedobacter lusitanus]|uniref:Uncharacterized protein n=1 Tax=Pedobacter lusitanus TaxID=1503925 RepID=A0A0D0GK43_9SPHI|nr:hypothetical protein TH53_08210 [Pedobacter lusitanus]